MDKSTFRSTILAIINRGNVSNTVIDAATQRAFTFLENNQNFRYMRKLQSFTKDPFGTTDEQSSLVPLGRNIKRFTCVRCPNEDPCHIGEYKNLRQVDEGEILFLPPATRPDWFYTYFDPTQNMIMQLGASSFDAAFQLDIFAYVKTDYNALGDTDAHWLWDNGVDWLTPRVMYNMAPILRQDDQMQAWKMQADEALVTLLMANAELEQGERDDRMGYSGEVIP